MWEKNQGINILPKDLKSLVGLTTLNLSSNGLTELPIEIGNLTNLKTLFLFGNDLTINAKSLLGLMKIEYLYTA